MVRSTLLLQTTVFTLDHSKVIVELIYHRPLFELTG